jgi:hypothetical protein
MPVYKYDKSQRCLKSHTLEISDSNYQRCLKSHTLEISDSNQDLGTYESGIEPLSP